MNNFSLHNLLVMAKQKNQLSYSQNEASKAKVKNVYKK